MKYQYKRSPSVVHVAMDGVFTTVRIKHCCVCGIPTMKQAGNSFSIYFLTKNKDFTFLCEKCLDKKEYELVSFALGTESTGEDQLLAEEFMSSIDNIFYNLDKDHPQYKALNIQKETK